LDYDLAAKMPMLPANPSKQALINRVLAAFI